MNIDIRSIAKKYNVTQKMVKETFSLASTKNWDGIKHLKGWPYKVKSIYSEFRILGIKGTKNMDSWSNFSISSLSNIKKFKWGGDPINIQNEDMSFVIPPMNKRGDRKMKKSCN